MARVIVHKKIKFPIIEIFGGEKISRTRKVEFQKFSGRLSSPNRLYLKNTANAQFRTTAIIDYDGKYYEVIPGKLNRSWLSGISRILDLTSMDCTLSEGRCLTVREMRHIARDWKNDYARFFRKFLAGQEPDALFDSNLFRQAWEHSYINLPEEEWGEDAFS